MCCRKVWQRMQQRNSCSCHRLAYLLLFLYLFLTKFNSHYDLSVHSAGYRRSFLRNTKCNNEFVLAIDSNKSHAKMGFPWATEWVALKRIENVGSVLRRQEKPLRLQHWAQTNDFVWCRQGAGVRKMKRRTFRRALSASLVSVRYRRQQDSLDRYREWK